MTGGIDVLRPWVAELEVTPEYARELILGQFPSLTPGNVESFGNGWDNTAVLVNKEYVFRFPRRKVALECMEAEIRVLPHITSFITLPASVPEFIGHPTDSYPYPFAGYRLLEGVTASEAQLNDEQRNRSATVMAKFLKTLHSFPHALAMELDVPPDHIGRMDINKRVPRLRELLSDLLNRGAIEEREISLFEPIIESACAFEHDADKTRVLVHGDLNFRNFLVDESGLLSGIIDWGDVHWGHPAVDLAIVACFFPAEGQKTFFETYGNVDESTRHLTRFRGLYFLCNYLLYTHDIGDRVQLHEGQLAVKRLLGLM